MDAAWAMLIEFLVVAVSSALLIAALIMLWYGSAPDRQQASGAGNHDPSETGTETPNFRRLLRTIYLAAAVASFVLPVVTLVLALTTS